MLKSRQLLVIATAALMVGCATSGSKQRAQSDAASYAATADRAYQAGDWKGAESHYREVIARVPNDPYAHFKLGNALLKLNRWDDAVQAYRAALAADPSYAKAASNLATLHLMQAEQALHIAIDSMKHSDPRAAMLMLREQKIHEVVDIPVDESRASGKYVSSYKTN